MRPRRKPKKKFRRISFIAQNTSEEKIILPSHEQFRLWNAYQRFTDLDSCKLLGNAALHVVQAIELVRSVREKIA